MNFRDLDIKVSYRSKGENNITEALIIPALKCCRIYKRSVGFFSSSVIESIIDGIIPFYRNNGTIQLIASPALSQEDIEAIKLGYKERHNVMNDTFSSEFLEAIEQCDEESLEMLSKMIAKGVLDIKLAITDEYSMYHDKLGIMEDCEKNIIVFYGSANSSKTGYVVNYEKIRVAKSWIEGQSESVDDEVKEFDELWNNKNEYVSVETFSNTEKQNLFKIVDRTLAMKKEEKNGPVVKLRDYQDEAINAWVENGYHGFYVMATGTGKTWTAIYSAKALVEKYPSTIIIAAPYKHLVEQWKEDVRKAFSDARIIMVSSENPNWDTEIKNEVLSKKYNGGKQLIVISTIVSFYKDRFEQCFNKLVGDRLLIIDEAHRFTTREEWLHDKYKYMLGLSATPFSGKTAKSGNELMNFFGGQVYNLPLEEALRRNCLVQYNYHPIVVYSTAEEEDEFVRLTAIMASCFKNGVLINKDKLVRAHRARLRVISMAEQKMSRLPDIIKMIHVKDHFVVYCGDGKLFDANVGEEIRHIRAVKSVLNQLGYRPSQFTANENMHERMELVDAFNKGEISALAAIRCLDEGINIPSIQSALILSSNDDYREFVQRRGRILRQYGNKQTADIYDVVVLPSIELKSWMLIELRRMNEYAKLALNKEEQNDYINKLLKEYDIKREEIEVFEYEDMEENFDE